MPLSRGRVTDVTSKLLPCFRKNAETPPPGNTNLTLTLAINLTLTLIYNPNFKLRVSAGFLKGWGYHAVMQKRFHFTRSISHLVNVVSVCTSTKISVLIFVISDVRFRS